MTFLVCRNKDDGSLFITTRIARETMLNVIQDLGQQPDSNVLKVCNSYEEADKYIKDQNDADKTINKLT